MSNTQVVNVSYSQRFEDLPGNGGRVFSGLDVRAEILFDGKPVEYFRFQYPSAPTKSIQDIVLAVARRVENPLAPLPEGVTNLRSGKL